MENEPLNPYASPRSEEQSEQPPQESVEPLPKLGEPLVVVATFQYAAQAHLCQALLQQHGIWVTLADEATVEVNFLWSNAIGGVKVQVATSDGPEAAKLLEEFHTAYASKDSQATPEDLGEVTFACEECEAEVTFSGERRGYVETCPKCHKYIDVPE